MEYTPNTSPKSGGTSDSNPGGRHHKEPLPSVGAHTESFYFRVHGRSLGRGMLYIANCPTSPATEVKEALMGFRVGDTGARVSPKSKEATFWNNTPI
jgi:hypothetical protein